MYNGIGLQTARGRYVGMDPVRRDGRLTRTVARTAMSSETCPISGRVILSHHASMTMCESLSM